jgi:hypothetical protein
MRHAVHELARVGPLPSSDVATEEQLRPYQELLASLTPPVTDEEARLLATLFGPDDSFGLAWTLLHLIESAPGWPLADLLEQNDEDENEIENEWRARLRRRAHPPLD